MNYYTFCMLIVLCQQLVKKIMIQAIFLYLPLGKIPRWLPLEIIKENMPENQQQPGARPNPYWSPVALQEMSTFLGNIYQPELTQHWSSGPLFHNGGISRVISWSISWNWPCTFTSRTEQQSQSVTALTMNASPAISTASNNIWRLYRLPSSQSIKPWLHSVQECLLDSTC